MYLILRLHEGVDPENVDLLVMAERGAWTVFKDEGGRVSDEVGVGYIATLGIESFSTLLRVRRTTIELADRNGP